MLLLYNCVHRSLDHSHQLRQQRGSSHTGLPSEVMAVTLGMRLGQCLTSQLSSHERPCCRHTGRACCVWSVEQLVIRVVDHRLDLVAAIETCCTECGAVLNSTLTSDRIEGSTELHPHVRPHRGVN